MTHQNMTEQQPHILWDWGTAYDLFASLQVLHHPDKFGLRGSWAAGVRSRLATNQRSVLEDSQVLFYQSPLVWVSSLPEPREAATVLRVLEGMAPVDRLPALSFHYGNASEIVEALKEISAHGSWSNADLNHLQQLHQQKGLPAGTNRLVIMLDWWSRPVEFGEGYLAALHAYVENFYLEEEQRIKPFLQQALARAQQMASQLDFPRLMVELSQGVKISAMQDADEVTFVPSYWTTPLVMYDRVIEKQWVVLFGARPADVSLVPGEVVPDAMLLALKALSDPTRLLILRYLSDQPQTPSQLARRLRLRAPTMTHHLSALRLAGLVYISLDEEEEKRYAVREAAVKDTFDSLHRFLSVNGEG